MSTADYQTKSNEDHSANTLDSSVSMGVDIVEIERMRAILLRTPSFAHRVFSEEEQTYCESTSAPVYHYATRFAAKEAVLKALGTGFSEGIGPRDVEIVLNAKGKPRVKLYRKAVMVAQNQDIVEIPVSLSYTHIEAVACALALKQDAIITAEKKINPATELTRQFKEARQMLDDLKPGVQVSSQGDEAGLVIDLKKSSAAEAQEISEICKTDETATH